MSKVQSKHSVVVRKRDMLYFFILMVVFQPIAINRVPVLKLIFNVGRLMSFFWVSIVFVKNHRKFTNYIYYQLFFWGCWFVSTLAYRNVFDCFSQLISKMMICTTASLLFEIMIRDDPQKAIKISAALFGFYVHINLLQAFVAPTLFGTDHTYLLGGRNATTAILVLYLMFAFLREVHSKKKLGIKSMISCVIVVFNGIYLGSETTRNVGVVAFLLVFILVQFKKNISYLAFPVLYISSFLLIVVNRVQYLIVDKLQFYAKYSDRDFLTFSGRTDIWNVALAMFTKRPFLGYGIYRAGNERISIWGGHHYAHNEIMEILVDGGILLLAAVILLIIIPARKMCKYKDQPCVAGATIAFISYAVYSMFEAPIFNSTQTIIYMLTVANCIDRIIIQKNGLDSVTSSGGIEQSFYRN